MTLQPSELRIRALVGGVCSIVIASLYFRTLARARSSHSIQASAYPWEDVASDILLFALVTICIACLLPVLRGTELWQRIVGVVFIALPVLILVHYIIWLLRLYAT